jgi:hypothetical protein
MLDCGYMLRWIALNKIEVNERIVRLIGLKKFREEA